MMLKPRAAAVTVGARFGPGFAAAAAMPAQTANRNIDRDDKAVPGLAPRHEHFAPQHVIVFAFAEKGVAHALDGRLDAREVDGDLVCKAVVGHRCSVNDR